MIDREMLELAAKAAGLGRYSEGVLTGVGLHKTNTGWVEWNPLTDDGDALRLAVKLGIDIPEAQVQYWDKYSNDPYAATRRAIVRAAAEIGKAMGEKP